MSIRNAQSGNALFVILIAVALLAALSFAVTQGNRGSTSQLSDEQARLAATDMIEYANVIANAVAQTRLRGFSDEQISFENDIAAGYTNGNCGDTLCRIFHPDGAGVSYVAPQESAMADTPAPDNLWHIYGDNEIKNIGSTCGAADCADLILLVDELDLTVCQQLNELLGVTAANTAPPTDAAFGEAVFVGAYGYSESVGDSDTALEGQRAACFQKTDATAEYAFYKVLISR